MSARSKARKRALDFLYEAEIKKVKAVDLFKSRGASELSQEPYVFTLLTGVAEHLLKIDELITTYAQDWDMDRMPAIDRNILVNQVLKSGQIPLYSVVTPTIEQGKYKEVKYHWSKLTNDQVIQNARELYKEAGYSNSHPLNVTLSYKTNDLYKKVAIAVSSMWSNVLGVKVTLKNQEWKSLIQSLHNADYDISFATWGADYNAIATYIPLYLCGSPNNYSHYCNNNYNELIQSANKTTNESEQDNMYKQSLWIVMNDYPVIPLFEPSQLRLVKSRVQNYRIEDNYLDNVQTKWMSLNTK